MKNFDENELFFRSTDFVQVGNRNYIQGIHIVDQMAEAIFEWPSMTADRFVVNIVKFTRKILSNGRVFVCPMDDEHLLPANGACTLYGTTEFGPTFVANFIPDPGDPIQKSIVRDDLTISEISNDGEYSGNFNVVWSDSNTYLKTLVEANKRAIENTLGIKPFSSTIEITTAENLLINKIPSSFEGPLSIENIGARDVGTLTYVLSALSWPGGSNEPVQLTFSVRK